MTTIKLTLDWFIRYRIFTPLLCAIPWLGWTIQWTNARGRLSVPSTAIEITIVANGSKIGSESFWIGSDGATYVTEQFSGQNVKESRYVLDEKNLPLRLDIEDIQEDDHEHFSVDSTGSDWASKHESGHSNVSRGFYCSRLGTPVERAILARALLESTNRSLKLLPNGEAKIDHIRDLALQSENNVQQISLFAISGLELTPVYVWLTPSGDFFALGDRYFITIRGGYDSFLPRIVEAQDEAKSEYFHAIEERLSHRPRGKLIIQNIAVFDSETGKILKDQTVVVIGNCISSVSRSEEIKHRPKAAFVIDGKGKTLLPGLWDMHQHVSGNEPLLDIASGVTTVRDLGNINRELSDRKRKIDSGFEIGPRITPAGFVDGMGQGSGLYGIRVATEADARTAVKKYSADSYQQIKIYGSLKPDLVRVIIDEAHKLGMRVGGHIPARMTATECVRLGFDEIQHMYFVFLNFMPDVKRTDTQDRFIEPAKRAAGIDLASPVVEQFLTLLKAHHVVIDPTLSVINDMFTGDSRHLMPSAVPIANLLPGQVSRYLTGDGLPDSENQAAQYKKSFEAMKAMLKIMNNRGIQLVAGTDSVLGGFALDSELELYVQSGIAANEVLRIATLGAARVMNKDDQLGSVEPGKLADLMIVSGDPTTRISDIRKVSTVIKDGVVYNPSEIERALGFVDVP